MRKIVIATALFMTSLNASADLPAQNEVDAMVRRQSAAIDDVLNRAQQEIRPRQKPKAEPMKDVAPVGASSPKDDLPELLRKMSRQRPGEGSSTDSLLVFISFSMPPRVIEELSRQAKESGAVLVLRGMKDANMRSTKEAAAKLNRGGAEWMIHPELFKQFKVDQVPSVVLAAAGADQVDSNGCAPDVEFASVVGEVSIEYALKVIRSKATPEIASMAATKLKLMGRDRR